MNRLAVAGLVIPLLALFVFMVGSVLVPVALGALFAVVLYPIVPWLATKLGRLRGLAPGVTLVGVCILVLVPMAFVAFMSGRTLKRAAADATTLRASAEQFLRTQAMRVPMIDADTLREQMINGVEALARNAGAYLGESAAAAPTLLVSTFMFMFALYFFLRDGPQLVRWLARLVPFAPEETSKLFVSVHQAIRGVVLSSILTGLLQSALSLLAMLIFAVPGAFLWSVVAFVLSFLPMVGTTPVTLGSTLYLFVAGRPGAASGMAVAALVIGVSDNFVRPLAQGVESKMHPLLTLMAIFGGLAALGAPGIFLGPVVAAMALWSVETYAEAQGVPRD